MGGNRTKTYKDLTEFNFEPIDCEQSDSVRWVSSYLQELIRLPIVLIQAILIAGIQVSSINTQAQRLWHTQFCAPLRGKSNKQAKEETTGDLEEEENIPLSQIKSKKHDGRKKRKR